MSKNILNFIHKEQNSQSAGVLFSIIYLWLELQKMDMPRTSVCVETAIDTFFDDLKQSKRLNNDHVQLHAIIKKMLSLEPGEVATFLNYMTKPDDDVR